MAFCPHLHDMAFCPRQCPTYIAPPTFSWPLVRLSLIRPLWRLETLFLEVMLEPTWRVVTSSKKKQTKNEDKNSTIH